MQLQLPDRHWSVKTNKSVCKIVFVGHVTFLTEIIVMTFGAMPPHANDARTTTYITRHKNMPRA